MTVKSRRSAKRVVHGTPIENENNLLDRFSGAARLDYFAEAFFAVEKALVAEKVATVVPRGTVLNVGCGRHGTERTYFPRRTTPFMASIQTRKASKSWENAGSTRA